MSSHALRFPPRPLTAVAALLLALSARPAAAQNMPLDQLRPTPMGDSFFAVQGFDVGKGKVDVSAGLLMEYAREPLVLYRATDGSPDTKLGALVSDQLFLHVGAAVGLFERLQVSLDLPIGLVDKGTNISAGGTPFVAPSGAALGDLRAGLRVRLYGDHRDKFGVALTGDFWFPTGTSGKYITSGTVRGQPGVAVGGWIGPVLWGVNGGVVIQKGVDLASSRMGTNFTFGGAAAVSLLQDRLQIGPELYGGVLLDKGSTLSEAARTVNLEAILGVKGRIGWLVLGAGAGPGITSGPGTPAARVLFTVQYSPSREDHDHDGILDRDDACPNIPGVPNGDPLKHGCPPADRDGDGVLDVHDACPDVPGKHTDDPKSNGCPDRDNDGIPDIVDACPDAAGKKTGDPKTNGCPDRDNDGIPDNVDACPEAAGPPDPDPAKNGCPPDRDGDKIPDAQDACPDKKGIADPDPKKNGCPPDTDGDGIVDPDDACPTRPGKPDPDPTKNGCPMVYETQTKIEILEQVQFKTGSDVILQASDELLGKVAQILKEHPEFTKILVEGHTDDRGGAAYNKGLSARRAASVKRWLVKHGIKANRLESQGFGQDQPIGDNSTEAGRQKNRRVEFKIVGNTSAAPPPKAPPPPPKAPPPKAPKAPGKAPKKK